MRAPAETGGGSAPRRYLGHSELRLLLQFEFLLLRLADFIHQPGALFTPALIQIELPKLILRGDRVRIQSDSRFEVANRAFRIALDKKLRASHRTNSRCLATVGVAM